MQNSFLTHHNWLFFRMRMLKPSKMWLSVFWVRTICGTVVKTVPLLNGKNTVPEEKVRR